MREFELTELPQARGDETRAIIKRWTGLEMILVTKDVAAKAAAKDLAAQMERDHVRRGVIVLSPDGGHGDLNRLSRRYRGSGLVLAMASSPADLAGFANRMAREFMETGASMLASMRGMGEREI